MSLIFFSHQKVHFDFVLLSVSLTLPHLFIKRKLVFVPQRRSRRSTPRQFNVSIEASPGFASKRRFIPKDTSDRLHRPIFLSGVHGRQIRSRLSPQRMRRALTHGSKIGLFDESHTFFAASAVTILGVLTLQSGFADRPFVWLDVVG